MTSTLTAPRALSSIPGLLQVTLPGTHQGPTKGVPFHGDKEVLKIIFDKAAGPQFSAQVLALADPRRGCPRVAFSKGGMAPLSAA